MANTKIPVELSSTPSIIDNGNATAIEINSSEHVTINGDTFINRGTQTSGVIKLGGTTDGAFVDFDGSSLQLNTQRDPNTGTFVNTAKSHASIILQGNNADSNIRLYTTNSNNTTATERMRINSGGTVTKPYQPAFWAFNDSMMTNVSTGYTDVNMGGDRYDVGGNFNNSNGQFTAPVTGKYYLEANIGLQNIPLDAAWLIIQIQTSNHAYNFSKPTLNWDSGTGGYIHTISCSTIADMDENDIAYVRFYQYTGTADTDIYGTGGNGYTYFCGYLLG